MIHEWQSKGKCFDIQTSVKKWMCTSLLTHAYVIVSYKLISAVPSVYIYISTYTTFRANIYSIYIGIATIEGTCENELRLTIVSSFYNHHSTVFNKSIKSHQLYRFRSRSKRTLYSSDKLSNWKDRSTERHYN